MDNEKHLTPDDNVDPAGFLPEGSDALAKYIEEDLDIESEDELQTELTKKDYTATYFLKAAEKGKLELVKKMLESNKSLVDSRDSDGYTPLHRACYNGHVEVIKVLLEYGADVSSQTENNWQPLHCACRWDQAGVASILLQNSADINAQTSGGHTPLHLAATHSGDCVLLEILLTNKNINPSITNCQNETALDLARRKGNNVSMFEVVETSVNVTW